MNRLLIALLALIAFAFVTNPIANFICNTLPNLTVKLSGE